MGFYGTSLEMWKSSMEVLEHQEGAEMLEKGVESEMLSFYRHFSGLNNEQLKDARMMRKAVKLKAFAFTGLLVTGFAAFVQLKNRNRFNK